MKQIIKLQEPQSLIEHRANQPAYYDGLPLKSKEELRLSLLSEQGNICCYCMKRIPEKVESNGLTSYEMKIEHFLCQDNFPNSQLAYSNLFAACTGNEGKPKKMQTCDTRKANLILNIDPTSKNPNCETLFKFNSEGEISSVDNNTEINRQLDEILNLNMQTLKDSRRQIYLEVQEKVENESKGIGSKQLKLKYLEQEKTKWLNRTDNKYRSYCMVAVYYLTKKIRANH